MEYNNENEEVELWNVKLLAPPPVSSCKVTTKEIDVRLLHAVLNDGVEFFENQQHLYTEAALLSRLVYRLKMKFRSSKDFKVVEKLVRALRTYLQMQFSRSLRTLLQSMSCQTNRTYMITKNMLDYVLVRTQGLGKILCRVLETCKIISILTQQKLKLGHFWKVHTIIYGITARIFVIAKSILKYACDMYANLLSYSFSLSNSGVQWLPQGYVFPSRLDEWLSIDWLDLEKNVIEIVDDEPRMSYFSLLDDSDDEVEICDEYVLINDTISGEYERHVAFNENEEDFKITIQNKREKEDDVIDISDVTQVIDTVDVIQVIDISDSETPRPRKRRQPQRDVSLVSLSSDIDIGEEIIDLSDTELRESPKKKQPKLNRSLFIPLELNSSQRNENTNKKRKRGNNGNVRGSVNSARKKKIQKTPNNSFSNKSADNSPIQKRKKKEKGKTNLISAKFNNKKKQKLRNKKKRKTFAAKSQD